MIRELIIRNFGAIKSADISLKDFNIFIGEQGAVVSVLDAEYQLIVADKIDSISDKESRVFSALLDLE